VAEDAPDEVDDGGALIVATWAGTGLFVVTAVLSAITSSMRAVGVIVALVLFALGTLAFLVSFLRAVERSRTEEIAVVQLYFLAGGCAPKAVRLHFMGALAVQVITAFATASARPFTAVAFGILVPMYGLGMTGLWASAHGSFAKRRKLRPKKIKK
jgi:hypothetical protein